MLIRFSVSNYLSFLNPAVFDMRPEKIQKDGDLGKHIHVDSTGKEVYTLPIGVIFGANASGKTNFITAISFMRSCVLGTLQRQQGPEGELLLPVVPFLLNPESRNEPSVFEVQFKYKEVVYNYGFAISEKQIHEEWLYAYFTRKETRLFHRIVDGKRGIFQWGAKLKNFKKIGAMLPSTMLAITFLESELLKPVFEWFLKLIIIFPNSKLSGLSQSVFQDPKFSKFLSESLHEIDTGIDKIISIKKEKAEKSLDQLPMSVRAYLKQTQDVLPANQSYQLFTHHAGAEGTQLPSWLESAGTLRMMNLLPVFYMMEQRTNNIFLIDELSSNLHPLLSSWFIQKFLSLNQQYKSQLVFTTHDTSLLSNKALRRDEIWFVDKDANGASSFSRLSEFIVSNGLNFENGYISGRFGGIPNLAEKF